MLGLEQRTWHGTSRQRSSIRATSDPLRPVALRVIDSRHSWRAMVVVRDAGAIARRRRTADACVSRSTTDAIELVGADRTAHAFMESPLDPGATPAPSRKRRLSRSALLPHVLYICDQRHVVWRNNQLHGRVGNFLRISVDKSYTAGRRQSVQCLRTASHSGCFGPGTPYERSLSRMRALSRVRTHRRTTALRR